MNKLTKQDLTKSELEYVETCWKQGYSDTYINFEDYLAVALRGKEISGSIYN